MVGGGTVKPSPRGRNVLTELPKAGMRGPCPTFELRSFQSAGHTLAPQIHVERVNEFLNQFLISGGVREENGDFNKDFKASDRELIQMVFKKWSSYGFLRWGGGEGVDRPGNEVGLESVVSLCSR